MTAVVLSDDILNGLLARPDHANIPCLQFLKASPRHQPCRSCGGAKVDLKQMVEGEHVRICAFQLPPDRLAELKKALQADQLVLYLSTPGFPRRAVL